MSTRRFPGAEWARVKRCGVGAGAWAAEKLVAVLSRPPSDGPVESRTARAILRHGARRTRIEVRVEAQGVTPACGDQRGGGPACLLPSSPLGLPRALWLPLPL
ncbi:hypothetical protein NDU88_000993 [Pleurodeles waltl]|uniref:Uncharacterized protein n=1 Tax=Pleurodeles waltl TaxID=8319 RepID=A0AAV7S632_PLEWA|nr:hypothetical protein NDU88_000993 [Pleurodeles waltl]